MKNWLQDKAWPQALQRVLSHPAGSEELRRAGVRGEAQG